MRGVRLIYFSTSMFLVLAWVSPVRASEPITLRGSFEKIPLKNNLSYYVDPTGKEPFLSVRKHFMGTPILNSYPNFGNSFYVHWLYFQVRSTDDLERKISLITKGIDSLQVYVTQGNRVVYSLTNLGGHIPIYRRERISPLLSASFQIEPRKIYSVWVRIRNVHYRLAASPFDLYEYEAGTRYILLKNFMYSIFIGSVFLILLFSVALVLYFNEKIYWYYLGCASCSLLIMLIYNDFYFLLTDAPPTFILNKNAFGVLSASVPVFYLLFAEKFLEIKIKRDSLVFKVSRAVIILQYTAMAILIAFGEALFDYKVIFYPTMGALSTITLFYLFSKFNTPQARLFFMATVPVTVTVIFETFSDLHQIPVQMIHDWYYLTTLTELLILTFGIVYRFRINEEEKFSLEKDVLELEKDKLELEKDKLEIESKTRNDLTDEIADKLHNDVSSDLVVMRSRLETLHQKTASEKDFKDWHFIFDRLNAVYSAIRDLSHQLGQTSSYMSLVSMLQNRYLGEDKVNLSYNGLFPEQVINQTTELIVFSVVSEIITNALKHAGCTAIYVQLDYEGDELSVLVEDDGIGFDMNKATNLGTGIHRARKSIKEKLKGDFNIDSTTGGTTVIIKVKLTPEKK